MGKHAWRYLIAVAFGLTGLGLLAPASQAIADGSTESLYLYFYGWPLGWLEGDTPSRLDAAARFAGIFKLGQKGATWQFNLLGFVGDFLVALAFAALV
ncbi:hypothetical protein [Lacticaseibacillus kribbianus]|uniref:hypothetical protein n=1 Tax=Lacticaseibacillus kribbianus TaxID=2926292 RepID=UPI001CD2BC89|nr:hypothetical protein [Lacticaseibacillus kribbianus]